MNMHREDQVVQRKPRATKPRKARAAVTASNRRPTADRRDRRWLFLLLLLLLLPVSFWLGRGSVAEKTAPPAPPATVSAAAPAAAPSPATVSVPAKPQVAAAKLPESAPPAASATITSRPERETTLLEVGVGTSTRGGLTLMFDHPVEWTTQNPVDGRAELDVEGVRALGTFPRNLPLPPGVKSIHAIITAPDMLNLKFELKTGVQAYTFPGGGPSASVNVYFRTPVEEAASGDTMRTGPDGIPTGIGNCGAANPASAKAVTLLQQSLDKNPAYSPVRMALAVLMTCNGNSNEAEQVMADGKAAGGMVKVAVMDAALLYARGDVIGAVQVLKNNASPKADRGYEELLADLTAAAE